MLAFSPAGHDAGLPPYLANNIFEIFPYRDSHPGKLLYTSVVLQAWRGQRNINRPNSYTTHQSMRVHIPYTCPRVDALCAPTSSLGSARCLTGASKAIYSCAKYHKRLFQPNSPKKESSPVLPLLEIFLKTNPTSNLLPSAFRRSQQAERHLIKASLWWCLFPVW